MNKRILMTGATGLIGQALTDALLEQGDEVHALSRISRRADRPGLRYFQWDVAAGRIDADCFDGVEAIVHLAGENIATKPWSSRRKQAILESRTQSIALLYRTLNDRPSHTVRTVISASASGYYADAGDEAMTEDRLPAPGFLGQTCAAWERAVSDGRELGLRTVSLRSGVILSDRDGFYAKLAALIRRGVAIIPGSGRQWLPWIHIDDAVAAYRYALEHNGMQGVYNMVAPGAVTFEAFIRELARRRGARIVIHVPAIVLKTVLGQLSESLLTGARLSADKLRNAGFEFRYPHLHGALAALTTGS